MNARTKVRGTSKSGYLRLKLANKQKLIPIRHPPARFSPEVPSAVGMIIRIVIRCDVAGHEAQAISSKPLFVIIARFLTRIVLDEKPLSFLSKS